MTKIDKLLTHLSTLDFVVTCKPEGSAVAIYVSEPVESCYPDVIALVRKHAPGIRGEVRRAVGRDYRGEALKGVAQ